MTFVTIPNRPLGTDVRSIEAILEDFDAITDVINGQLDASNFTPGTFQTTMQPGMIIPSAAVSHPGFLLCDGALYNNSDYPALSSAIGTKFGGSVGVNFNVPDLRTKFPMGADTGSNPVGRTGGAASHTHGPGSFAIDGNHVHYLDINGVAVIGTDNTGGLQTLFYNTGSGAKTQDYNRAFQFSSGSGGGFASGTFNHATTGLTGRTANSNYWDPISGHGDIPVTGASGGAFNFPPFVAVNFFIKT